MGLADTMGATAQKMLATFGASATMRKVVPGRFQPGTDSVANTDVDIPVKALFVSSRKGERGTGKATEHKVLVEAVPLDGETVDSTWKFVVGTAVYEVVDVEPTMVGDVPVMFTLTVRS